MSTRPISRILRLLPLLGILLILADGQTQSVTEQSLGVESTIPGLERSAEVIKAKIERKERKLAANRTGDRPQAPLERGAWRKSSRGIDEDTRIYEKLLEAKSHLERMPPREQKDAGIAPTWEQLGPGNIGGRVRALAFDTFDSDHMILGSVSGGLWQTWNGGSTWYAIDDFLPTLSISSIVCDQIGYWYAGTGEIFSGDGQRGAGVFRSTDDGMTWQQMANTLTGDFDFVSRLALDYQNPGHVYAVTENGLWLSEDYAVTWTQVRATNDPAQDVDVFYNSSAQELWIALGTRRELHVSRDGGTSWSIVTSGNPGEIPAAATNTNMRCEVNFAFNSGTDPYLYASIDRNSGEIWRSLDGGVTWSLRSTGTNYLAGQGGYDNVIWAEPGNPDRLLVGGIDLYRSTNGGSSLTRISDWREYHTGQSAHADQHLIIPHPDYEAGTWTRVYFGNDGGLQYRQNPWSGDDLTGWVNMANGLYITQFYHVAAGGSMVLGGAQDNSVLRRISEGTTSWLQGFTGDGAAVAVHPNDNSILWACTQYGKVRRSDNGGSHWDEKISGLTNAGDRNVRDFGFIAPMDLDENDPNDLVIGGRIIYRTISAADSWTAIRDTLLGRPRASAVKIANTNSFRIWVGYEDGTVSRTVGNDVNTWVDVNNNGVGLPNRWVRDIAVNPNDQNDVLVCYGGFNADNVWRSQDGGSTWTQVTGTAPYDLPAIPTGAVTFHPENSDWMYVGTDLGMLASEDGGNTWSRDPLYPGLEGPVNTEISDFFWDGMKLYVATYGRGIWRIVPYVGLWVDHQNTGTENGSSSFPFDTVVEGRNAMGSGTNMYIRTGTYQEPPLVFDRRGKIQAVNGTVVVK